MFTCNAAKRYKRALSLKGSLLDDGANLAPGSDERARLASLSTESSGVRIARVSKHTSSLKLWRKRLEHVPALPNSIDNLKRLRELHLRNNRLASIPDSIGNLQELRQLDLRGNPLTYLPRTIAKLSRLEKLDLRWVDTLIGPGWIKAGRSRMRRLLLMIVTCRRR
jgi:hypothetical protein